MSYEPTLIIRRSDLEKNREEIEKKTIYSNRPVKEEWNAVYKALETEEMYVIKFPEIELIIIRPEFTEHNKKVRKILHDLDIEFHVDY